MKKLSNTLSHSMQWVWKGALLLLLLFAKPPQAMANDYWINLRNGTITADKPYLHFEIMIYDANGTDSFFDGGKNDMSLSVDGVEIATGAPVYELLNWTGWDNMCNSIRGIDHWVDFRGFNTFKKNGVTLKAYNPYVSGDRMYVQIFVFFDYVEAGSVHTFSCKGKWRWNRNSAKENIKIVSSGATYDPFGKLGTLTYNTDKTMNYSATLPSTKWASNINFYKKNVSPADLANWQNTVAGSNRWLTKVVNAYTTSTGQLTWGLGDNTSKKEVYPIFHQNVSMEIDGYKHNTVVYKNYGMQEFTGYQGYSKPKNLVCEKPNMWNKKAVLQWEAEDTDKNTEGTWSIYRRLASEGSSARMLVTKNISYGTEKRTYQIDPDKLDYDTDYIYEVAFIPNAFTNGAFVPDLSSSVNVNVKREFPLTDLKVVPGSNKITFSWRNPAFQGTETYTFDVFRSINGGEWNRIATVPVTDKNKTEYSFVDTNPPSGCDVSFYKVAITMLGGKLFEPTGTMPSGQIDGQSSVISVSATKGDFAGMVKIVWDAEQIGSTPTRYEVYRRIAGSNKARALIYKTTGLGEAYFFEDNTALPGQFYEYEVESSFVCKGEYTKPITKSDVGFCRTTGIVSGRVFYDTGTAVPDAKVCLIKDSNNTITTSQFYSLQTSGVDDGVHLDLDSAEIKNVFESQPYSAQFYVRPQDDQTATTPVIFDISDRLMLQLGAMTGGNYPLNVCYMTSVGYKTVSTGVSIPANRFTSLTFSKDKSGVYSVTLVDENGTVTTKSLGALNVKFSIASKEDCGITYGGAWISDETRVFKGYVDEMRMFTGKTLTEKEILKNYNRTLTGSEDGLYLYWPVDDYAEGMNKAFDYSKTAGVPNGHHASFGVSSKQTSAILPTEDQLSLFAYTDTQGNYVIRGVPFTGEGTNYTVRPMLGTHEFSPNYSTRFVSASSLIHNSADFTDVSSFKVTGKVYYANTNYPVEGCNLYVDGVVSSKDGEVITTDSNGEYTISVPIGQHFISIKKDGHTFVNDGRYPKDIQLAGTKAVFSKEMSIDFTDNTLVNLTGRIVGGDIEGDKQLGFGLSENNIGVAEIVLTPNIGDYNMNVVETDEGTVYMRDVNPDELPVESYWNKIQSTSWRGGGDDNCKKFFIRTDPNTGEFSAMVPPITYKVLSRKLIGTKGDEVELIGSGVVDLSNPSNVLTDTLFESNIDYTIYYYNAVLNETYHSKPQFAVKQHNSEGFGISEYEAEDALGKAKLDVYSVGNDGKVTYTYNYPLFKMGDFYTFDLKGYEEYTNADNGEKSTVPLRDIPITIENALSDAQEVQNVDANGKTAGQVIETKIAEVVLDSLGTAQYRWRAGLPNITSPFNRTINMKYYIGDRQYNWMDGGMPGVILGDLSTGSNFTTLGPDIVTMVLRDPPGSKSYAEWTQGTSYTKLTTEGRHDFTDEQTSVVVKIGTNISTVTGIGVAMVNQLESKDDLEVGVHLQSESENSNTTILSTEVTSTISTSDSPEYVGASGDVYIGTSTNILFGKSREVGLYRDGDKFKLDHKDIIKNGLSFATSFKYSQYYIENTLIPHYEERIKSMLTYATTAQIANYTNNTNDLVYLTTLKPGDKGYGTANTDKSVWGTAATSTSYKGKSYTVVAPKNMKVDFLTDSLNYYITQIENWKKQIRMNEKEKVLAADNAKPSNISFDAGSKITNSYSKTTGKTDYDEFKVSFGALLNNSLGFAVNGTGCMWNVNAEGGFGDHGSTETTRDTTNVFSYTLEEEGSDALTVDIYENYGEYSPIFHTRGGQTSAPYEGEVKTKYYQPGTVIMEGTMQIEVPRIAVDQPSVVDVPSGGAANYVLRLTNESEIDSDVYYKLLVDDESNPDGAQISIDGMVLTENRLIKIPAGQTVTKALQLRQTNPSILDYNNIGVVLASQSQYDPTSNWDQIADTVLISAQFVPSASEVEMLVDNDVLNTSTGTTLNISFRNFDRNYHNQKSFRIEYRAKGDTSWSPLKEYMIAENDVKYNYQELLPAQLQNARMTYPLVMTGYNDGEYSFRVVSTAKYGADEVTRSSEEITVIKDMSRPRLLTLPSPSDGILNAGDEISILFNEDIVSSSLNLADNFLVTGDLGDAAEAHNNVFAVDGTEGAKTTTEINLSNRSFAFDGWINWTKPGKIFSHGKGDMKFEISISGDKKLVVNNGAQILTSALNVPDSEWCYLGVAYDYALGSPTLSAQVAYDAYSDVLFDNEPADVYEGCGLVTIGEGISASIHEVCLWNFARSFEESVSMKNQTKSASTDGLIGYWRLNEGHGSVAEDRARSRHLTLPSENCWKMANENLGIYLDGKTYAAINTGDRTTTKDEDWMVEFWFKADKPSGKASIFSFGNSSVDLYATPTGAIELSVKGKIYPVGTGKYLNNAWHHVALNVMKGTGGSATVYIDGESACQFAASAFPAMEATQMVFGAKCTTVDNAHVYSQFLKANYDELRYWKGTVSKTAIKENMYTRLIGDEAGLAAYYPFEVLNVDPIYHTLVLNQDLKDRVKDSDAEIDIFTADNGGGYRPMNCISSETPALKAAESPENLRFSFVANERQIIITLDDDASRLEGNTVTFTIKGVRDLHGNVCAPITWTAYVNQNRLKWTDNEIIVRKEGTEDTTFETEIVNLSGNTENWSISGMPMWLKANVESGTLGATGNKKITFTVDGSTSVGNYEAVIMLTGNNGVSTPLVVNLVSVSEKPAWAVVPAKYSSKMNVIGKISIGGIISNDSEDLIAAFIDNECRGLVSPKNFARYDGAFVMLDVYGDVQDSDKEIQFKVFDNSTGVIYPSVTTDRQVVFGEYTIEGTLANPVIFTTDNRQEQSTELRKGWNWISLYVTDKDMSPDAVFAKSEPVVYVKSKVEYAERNGDTWIGNLKSMTPGSMYRVQADAPTSISFMGVPVDASKSAITVNYGWNWIGYNGTSYMSVDEAFAGLEPEDGDVLNSLGGFSMYDSYGWIGTLTTLVPGQGYAYNSVSSEQKSFCYPRSSGTSQLSKANRRLVAPAGMEKEHAYSGAMCVVAQVMDNDKVIDDAVVMVSSNGEVRSKSSTTVGDALYFISVGGEGFGDELDVDVLYNGNIYTCNCNLVFDERSVIGNVKSPFVLNIANATAIRNVNSDEKDEWYDVTGRRLNVINRATKGVYIHNSKKVMK